MATVYVSSTFADLELERQAVMEWLVAAGHQPVHSYRPDSETVRDSCLDDVGKSDLYVLILGHRYGFQPEEANPEKLSITHLEFRRAKPIPRIALIRTSVPDIRLSDLLDPQKAALVCAFQEEVRREVRPAEFRNLQGLIQGLSTGVQSELDKLRAPSEHHRAEGWLAAHLQNVASQFASHMAASILKSGTRPEEFYLDLVVTERNPGKEETVSSEVEKIAKESYPLQEILAKGAGQFLLVGEGGSGKTTSLLYTAARAAERAKADQTAPVPICANLARVTKLDDVPDLLQLIADSVPLVKDWNELSNLGIAERRQMIFMFDSFNEMPEPLQRNGAVILKRFADKQKDRHVCLIGSRLVPHIEQLTRPPSQFKTFEILRLTSDEVRGFLQKLGLGSLYERIPKELRELAGNPFMLLAIARTLAGAPENTLPRNRGKLYQRFVGGWMDNEGKNPVRDPEYSYERVKEPLLAYLAKRMTSAGQTSLAFTNTQEEEVKRRLEAIYQRIEHLGGMPDNWKVDRCLAEILGDGLLKRADEQLHFMHQSVQEYFTSHYFSHNFPDALVDFTPKLLWEFVPIYELAELPNHRFVPPLLMMVGLLDDSTKVVEALAARNPILAAAAVSSASRVKRSLLTKLEHAWLNLLKHDDERHRMVGCCCLATASMTNRRVIQRLVEVAFESDYSTSKAAALALQRLDAPEVASQVLIELVLHWTDDKYDKQEARIVELLGELQTGHTVNALFERWRASTLTSPDLTRIEALLATVDESLRAEELRRIRSETCDPAVAADVDKALAEGTSWKKLSRAFITPSLLERAASAQLWWEIDRAYQAATELHNIEDQELADAVIAQPGRESLDLCPLRS